MTRKSLILPVFPFLACFLLFCLCCTLLLNVYSDELFFFERGLVLDTTKPVSLEAEVRRATMNEHALEAVVAVVGLLPSEFRSECEGINSPATVQILTFRYHFSIVLFYSLLTC